MERIENAKTLQDMLNLYWLMLDESEGEITESIELLELKIANKQESTLKYLTDLSMDIEELMIAKKGHIKKLSDAYSALEKKNTRIKNFLLSTMSIMGITKYDSGVGSLSIRESKSVNIIDIEKLASKYVVVKTTSQADKKLIKEDLKLGAVDGAELKINTNLSVKG